MPTLLVSDIPLDALVVKMIATATVVIAVSWAVGVFGPLIGGALAGLPISLGPGFYFLIQQSPTPFVAKAAAYALLSLCATQCFLLVYIVTAHRGKPFASLGRAIGTWLVGVLLVGLLPAQPLAGLLLFAFVTAACVRLGAGSVGPVPPTRGSGGYGLLLLRGILAGALVAVVTTASHSLGSTVAGLFLAFPIGYTVMAVTIHQKYGAASIAATLHSALLGTVSLAGFCGMLALTLPHWPTSIAFVSALTTSMLITLGLVFRGRTLAALGRR